MDIFEEIVRKEFGPMCQIFHLRVERIGDGEIALIGATCILLVWLDREGVSVQYVRMAGSKFYAIDIGKFIALKRGWVPCRSPQADEDAETRLCQECASYALNLQNFAEDILRGRTDWLNEVSGSASSLSDATGRAIRAALEGIR